MFAPLVSHEKVHVRVESYEVCRSVAANRRVDLSAGRETAQRRAQIKEKEQHACYSLQGTGHVI